MQPQDPAESVENRVLAPVYRIDDLVVDTGRVTITRAGQELALPNLSFELLQALIEAAPRVVSPDELMDRVWSGLVVGPETVSQRIKLLRDSLGDDPKSPRYVVGVRGRGYRLLPPVVRLETADGTAELVGAAPSATAAPSARWQLILPVVTLAIVVAGAVWLLLDRGRDAAPADEAVSTEPLPARSVAVLAFEDRGGAAGAGFLAEGIPETVLHQLARLPGLTVIARGSSFAFQDHPDDLRVIGRKLNVRYLLEGTVQTAGQRLRVTSSLVDAQTGASVWSMQFDRAPQDVFAVQDEIAIEVARAMRLTLDAGTDAVASLRRGATKNYEAYLAFLQGRALLASLRVADMPAAIESLAAAVRHDPEFASAYVLLARARVALAEQNSSENLQESFPKAIESAMGLLEKAIALDPDSGEAYVERGYLKVYFDLAAADADLRRGLELAPNYARGYEGLAAVLFQSVARRREALEMVEKARRLDPLEPRLDVLKATYLLWGSGELQQAAQLLETVLERNPLYVPAIVRLAEVRWCHGEHAESLALLEQAVALDSGHEFAWRQLAASYLELGEIAAAESGIRHLTNEPYYGPLSLHLWRKEWREAGEAAYAMIAAGQTHPRVEAQVSLAIRRHARATGDYQRAIEALGQWATVSWDGDEPLLQGQLNMGMGVAGLADMLIAMGQEARATTLLEELLADLDIQINRYGRGQIWLNDARAVVFTLLGRPEEAMTALQHQARTGFYRHAWRILLENEPVFDSLRGRKDFQTLLANARANSAREREQLVRMRKDGLVPERS
jgi:TolB-like protein/DNA-binding winged helix-turn-helix (wHTH) protein/Tfp pilus assembly protein PilF